MSTNHIVQTRGKIHIPSRVPRPWICRPAETRADRNPEILTLHTPVPHNTATRRSVSQKTRRLHKSYIQPTIPTSPTRTFQILMPEASVETDRKSTRQNSSN